MKNPLFTKGFSKVPFDFDRSRNILKYIRLAYPCLLPEYAKSC